MSLTHLLYNKHTQWKKEFQIQKRPLIKIRTRLRTKRTNKPKPSLRLVLLTYLRTHTPQPQERTQDRSIHKQPYVKRLQSKKYHKDSTHNKQYLKTEQLIKNLRYTLKANGNLKRINVNQNNKPAKYTTRISDYQKQKNPIDILQHISNH